MSSLIHRLFLEERPSLSLAFFRMAVALTTGFHVLPSFCHLDDNYLSGAFKTLNTNFFTPEVLKFIAQSPDGLIVIFVGVFCVSWFFFLIGFLSQISCIILTISCYYFYALNAFPIGTLSWDILLVTLFLMCLTPYHGDYFSLDSLFQEEELAYRKRRPFFIQRLLQIQIAFTFFYTALFKIYPEGNWITGNPLYYLMNEPAAGVVKTFLLRDFLKGQPTFCYILGITILTIEFLMVFLLFCRRTRLAAIYLGIFFHVTLILTFDVPAIFFFLFPPQLLLFINPEQILSSIEQKRLFNQSSTRISQLIYDGKCQFCRRSIRQLKILDLFSTLKYVDLHAINDYAQLHPALTKEAALSQLYLVEPNGRLRGGFDVFRRICFTMPMLYPLIPIFYFPGVGGAGKFFYRLIAKNRYFFHGNRTCQDNACYRAQGG